jgi:GntR family transcriptional regulator
MVVEAKYRSIAKELANRIRRGEMSNHARLPGELDLAEEFSVSRGTIRQALATLQQGGLVETALGAGSFVTYDGRPIDDGFGWSKSFARSGAEIEVKLVALGKLELPSLAEELKLDSADFLAVDRTRVLPGGEVISLERSRLPWRKSFETVLVAGLVDGSIQSTLSAHGIVSVGSREVITVAVIGSQDAKILNREPGDAFLENEQTSFDAEDRIVERVSSLLDPKHFRLENTFGRRPPIRPDTP